MNILVSNDDGITTEGIKSLAKAMSSCGDVYVVAPHVQRSASSHALSVSGEITLREVEFEGAKKAYECDGTPADCVKLGIDMLKQEGVIIDVVYAGINHGGNLGTDTMYSGTVSAAAEGMMAGLPAVAVSVNSHEASYFEGACRLAVQTLPLAMSFGRKGVISINTPDIPAEEIRGVKACKLGAVEYDQWFEEISRGGDSKTYRYRGTPSELDHWTEDMDVRLIRQGYATISAIRYDLNDYEGLKEIKGWELNI